MKLIFTFLLISQTFAFWSTGHMIVARIAYERLKDLNPHLLSHIEDEIKILSEFAAEGKYNFVEASNWPDDIKEVGVNQFTPWHVDRFPHFESEFKEEPYKERMDVIWAINQMITTLNFKGKGRLNPGFGASFSWRFLIHLIGDIHQPLHASQRYSETYPEGDNIGHSFKFKYHKEEMSDLHSFWDACVDQYGSLWNPLTEQEWDLIGQYAGEIMAKFPPESVKTRLEVTDPLEWAKESHELAIKYVYTGIKENEELPQEYIDRGRILINEQIALAGYRMADLFLKISDYRFSEIDYPQEYYSY